MTLKEYIIRRNRKEPGFTKKILKSSIKNIKKIAKKDLTYNVRVDDSGIYYVGKCAEMPSIKFTASSPMKALKGIYGLVEETLLYGIKEIEGI